MNNQNANQQSLPRTKQRMEVPLNTRRRSHRFRNAVIILLILFIFFTPMRTTVLLIGIDRSPEGTAYGRSDTMILATLPSVLPRVSLLSIPRDLWVNIPGYGENRINTAHYFAELDAPGTGMSAAAGVVEANFGIKVPYVIRIKFDGFIGVVDAMGGVTVNLPQAMSGLEAGPHTFDGTAALAFVRDRSGSDDFWRQQRGQLFISAALNNLLSPAKWGKLPATVTALTQAIDTNIPFWLWPRMLYGIAFTAIKGFDSMTIDREMVTPWVTSEGAQVLLPNWELINPVVEKIFK